MVSKVLDASAFYAGIPFAIREKIVTTNLVYEEIKHIKKSHGAVDFIVENKRLVLVDPEEEYINKAVSITKKTGDFCRLSQEDLSVISLALQYKDCNDEVILITDDYSVSNVARYLGIQVRPIMTRGPPKNVLWDYFCPGCDKSIDTKEACCPLCGTQLELRKKKRK